MLSFKENIPVILKIVENVDPKLVLDIGAGMGKYGLLIREQYLSSKAEKGELEPSNDIIIDAVEDTPYLLHKIINSGIYNEVIDKDIFKIIDENKSKILPYYDLALLIDTVEHWEKDKAINLIRELLSNVVDKIIVSTPKRVGMYKDHFYGDPRHHITQYSIDDFKEFQVEDHSNNFSHIFLLRK